jgi:DNA-binding transcriptional LysR family regulator
MQMETLRMFCDLVETKSFSRAAERLGVTPSAVSQMLATLERAEGSLVAVRAAHGLQLTPAGEIYYHYCREIVQLADELDRQLHVAKVTVGGVIELAACYSVGLHQLPPLLKQFQQDFPAVQVRVHYGLIDQVHDEVTENAVDLGLVCYPRRLHGLAIEPFRHERLMLVCHPRHPLAARPAVTVPELTGQKFVAWTEIHRSPFLRRVPHNLRHHFEPAREFNEVEMVKCVVEQGDGIAILPETLVRSEVAHQRLAAVPFENGQHTEPLAVIYRQSRTLSPAMKSFIQALKQPVGATN